MQKITSTAIISVCWLAIFGSLGNAQYPSQIKIMTYNIQAENATHSGGDYSDIATVIKAVKPAICGMQKVDSLSAAKPVDVLKYLGEQTTMMPTFSMSYKKGSGAYGNGFLSDSVPKSIRHLELPKGNASEDRSALEIGITMGGERVRFIVTHLGYDNATVRTSQINQILPWIDAGGTATDPVVIMADFNAGPAENSMKLFETAGFSYVKGKNGQILDTSSGQGINHILYRPAAGWTVVDAGNPKYAASNRNPVWADMKIIPVAVIPINKQDHRPASLIFQGPGRLSYELAGPANVSLQIYNAGGQTVQSVIDNRFQKAGCYSFTLSESKLSGGIRLAVLTINGKRTSATTGFVP